MRIAILGSGNVATFFGLQFKKNNHTIVQVISSTTQHAEHLATLLDADFATDINQLTHDADVYLFAVSDDVILNFAKTIKRPNKLIIHTAGSIQLSELALISENSACIWPLYSIQKNNLPDSNTVPLIINASNETSLQQVIQLANAISSNHFFLNEKQKSMAHLAAVFANNFTNHLYTLSEDLLHHEKIPFELILPLIEYTTQKLHQTPPHQNQTGPAIRHDEVTMQKHLDLLQNDEQMSAIYKLLSNSIQKKSIV